MSESNIVPITPLEAEQFSVFALSLVGSESGGETDEHELSKDEPLKPNIDTREREFDEREVRYEVHRGPNDAVLSGPVTGGWGPGRYFQSKRAAYIWLVGKFGSDRVRFLEGRTVGRWAFIIKDLKENQENHG